MGAVSIFSICGNAAAVWNNMPTAETEFKGATDHRNRVLLGSMGIDYGYSHIRMTTVVSITGSGRMLYPQWSPDEVTWYDFSSSGTPPSKVYYPSIDLSTVGTKVTSWLPIPIASAADVFIRIVGSGTTTVSASPQIGMLEIQAILLD